MTPTPAWYEADSDDSDRNATDENTASTPDEARGANLPASDAPGGYADADELRGRIAAMGMVSAENERLRSQRDKANLRTLRMWERAKAAEAKLRDVETLADLRDVKYPERFAFEAAENHVRGYRAAQTDLHAVLARSQAPQAPAEQGAWFRDAITLRIRADRIEAQ